MQYRPCQVETTSDIFGLQAYQYRWYFFLQLTLMKIEDDTKSSTSTVGINSSIKK